MQLPTGTGTQNVDLQMVLDGDTMYLKMPAELASQVPAGKPWVSMDLKQMARLLPSGLQFALEHGLQFTDPGQYLDFLRATTDDGVKDLGQETVDGAQTTHYQATSTSPSCRGCRPQTSMRSATSSRCCRARV